jgi:hypothetical protein
MQLGGDVTQIEKIRQCKYVLEREKLPRRNPLPKSDFLRGKLCEHQVAQELACADKGV